jgi:hypothetical protein
MISCLGNAGDVVTDHDRATVEVVSNFPRSLGANRGEKNVRISSYYCFMLLATAD